MTDRFALHYVPDGYAVGGNKPMGRQAAGAGLLRAVAQDATLERIGCFGAGEAHARECERLLRDHGYQGKVERMAGRRTSATTAPCTIRPPPSNAWPGAASGSASAATACAASPTPPPAMR
jgi:hypothetical protein